MFISGILYVTGIISYCMQIVSHKISPRCFEMTLKFLFLLHSMPIPPPLRKKRKHPAMRGRVAANTADTTIADITDATATTTATTGADTEPDVSDDEDSTGEAVEEEWLDTSDAVDYRHLLWELEQQLEHHHRDPIDGDDHATMTTMTTTTDTTTTHPHPLPLVVPPRRRTREECKRKAKALASEKRMLRAPIPKELMPDGSRRQLRLIDESLRGRSRVIAEPVALKLYVLALWRCGVVWWCGCGGPVAHLPYARMVGCCWYSS